MERVYTSSSKKAEQEKCTNLKDYSKNSKPFLNNGKGLIFTQLVIKVNIWYFKDCPQKMFVLHWGM